MHSPIDSTVNISEAEKIYQEMQCFKQHNPNSILLTVTDDAMEPYFNFGDSVGGIRIRPTQPRLTKPELTPHHPRWNEAKEAIKSGRKEGVLKSYSISDSNLKLIEK